MNIPRPPAGLRDSTFEMLRRDQPHRDRRLPGGGQADGISLYPPRAPGMIRRVDRRVQLVVNIIVLAAIKNWLQPERTVVIAIAAAFAEFARWNSIDADEERKRHESRRPARTQRAADHRGRHGAQTEGARGAVADRLFRTLPQRPAFHGRALPAPDPVRPGSRIGGGGRGGR